MHSTSEAKIVLRSAVSGDEAFIYATWLRGLYYGNDWFNEISKDAFFGQYHKVLEVLIPHCNITVACLEDDPDVIVGYSAISDTTLHWVFIKKAWRRLGIAKKLVPSNIEAVSHLTKLGKKLKPKEWVFNPFIGENK